MNKKIIITLIVLISVTLGIIIFFLIINRQPSPSPVKIKQADLSQADQNMIRTDYGPVNLENVYQEKINEFPTKSFTFRENPDYSIAYFPKNQQFSIIILNENFEETRIKAEKEFLEVLGEQDITKICSLNVYISTITAVNPDLAGINVGLSMCQ